MTRLYLLLPRLLALLILALILPGSAAWSHTWDAAGRLLQATASATTTYAWNASGTLRAIEQNNLPLAWYDYDARGLRTAKHAAGHSRYTVWNGTRSYLELNAAKKLVARYEYAPNGRTPAIRTEAKTAAATTEYLHGDAMGSVSLSTGASKSPTWSDYQPFGQTDKSGDASANKFGFTGYEEDAESGLHYAQARYYDSDLGRFISGDAHEGEGNLPASWNAWQYAYNNPFVWVDPDGNEDLTPIDLMAVDKAAQNYEDKKAAYTEFFAAGCAIRRCSAGYPVGSEERARLEHIEQVGGSEAFALLRKELEGIVVEDISTAPDMPIFHPYRKPFEERGEYGRLNAWHDAASRNDREYAVTTRAGGVIQAAGAVGGGAAACWGSWGSGCVVVALPVIDNAVAGARTAWTGERTSTLGAAALTHMGVPEQFSELIYDAGTGLMAGGVWKFSARGAVAANASGKVEIVTVHKSKYPQAAQHVEDAIKSGHPQVLTVDHNSANAVLRRKESMRGIKVKKGLDRDEYPPAMFEEGGAGASVRYIDPSDNRGAGACIGAQCKKYSGGTKVKIEVTD